MPNYKTDLAGRRFGRWQVRPVREQRQTNIYWLCECDCGTQRMVRGTELLAGRSRSCGCSREWVKQGKEQQKQVRLDYRCYSHGRRCFDRWRALGVVSEQRAASLLRKNNDRMEYRIHE